MAADINVADYHKCAAKFLNSHSSAAIKALKTLRDYFQNNSGNEDFFSALRELENSFYELMTKWIETIFDYKLFCEDIRGV